MRNSYRLKVLKVNSTIVNNQQLGDTLEVFLSEVDDAKMAIS